MKKIIINNKCTPFGGFSLSQKAILRYGELKGFTLIPEYFDILDHWFYYFDNGECFFPESVKRDDPILISVVEELGKEANSEYSKLRIMEISDDVKYKVIPSYERKEVVQFL